LTLRSHHQRLADCFGEGHRIEENQKAFLTQMDSK
jgi:hypothetical protein